MKIYNSHGPKASVPHIKRFSIYFTSICKRIRAQWISKCFNIDQKHAKVWINSVHCHGQKHKILKQSGFRRPKKLCWKSSCLSFRDCQKITIINFQDKGRIINEHYYSTLLTTVFYREDAEKSYPKTFYFCSTIFL